MADWFTSDTHFNHENIIQYCHRPFADVGRMNAALFDNWNSFVANCDTVYHLGDFAMGRKEIWPEIRRRLNGNILLIRGNHDTEPWISKAMIKGRDGIWNSYLYEAYGMSFWLAHVPFGSDYHGRDLEPRPTPPKGVHVDLHLCGHIHNAWKMQMNDGEDAPTVNVGVDVWGYRPISIDEIVEYARSVK